MVDPFVAGMLRRSDLRAAPTRHHHLYVAPLAVDGVDMRTGAAD
jgi:hypothetical protein